MPPPHILGIYPPESISETALSLPIDALTPAAADSYGLDPFSQGVALIQSDGVAAAQGFRAGDVVKSVNGERIASTAQLAQALRTGDWTIVIDRGGREITAQF